MVARKTNKKTRKDREGLSQVDMFFIEGHPNMSIEELSVELNQPVDLIKDFCQSVIDKEKIIFDKNPKNKPANKLVERPVKGVVVMTEAASSVGDDQYSKYVTPEAINRAMQDGNFELAQTLKKRLDDQQKSNQEVIKNKYRECVHYITDLEEI